MAVEQPTELYRKHRPKLFKELLGRAELVQSLQDKIKAKRFPRTTLLAGGSGTGKTTLARILRDKLDCVGRDYQEINSADFRGIDMVRDVRTKMQLKPGHGGTCRMWVIDECHKLSNDAQNAFLKILEEVPSHVYFILCTTDPQKLIKTIVTRCFPVKLDPLTPEAIAQAVRDVAGKEGIAVTDALVERIVEVSEGSGRQALQFLEAVRDIKDEKDRLRLVVSEELKDVAYAIAKALVWGQGRTSWAEVAKLIPAVVDNDVESLRLLVLACASKEVLKGGNGAAKAFQVLCAFESPFFNSGKNGLVRAAWEVFSQK